MVDIPSSDGGAFKSMLVRVQSWAPLKKSLQVQYLKGHSFNLGAISILILTRPGPYP
jgi:hypothetical protein